MEQCVLPYLSIFMECYKLGKKTLFGMGMIHIHQIVVIDFKTFKQLLFHILIHHVWICSFLGNHDIVYHFENQQKTFTLFNPQANWWF
jgi:hypothetical protein